MEQNELGTVTLYLDNDETIECQILCVLDVNKQQYNINCFKEQCWYSQIFFSHYDLHRKICYKNYV